MAGQRMRLSTSQSRAVVWWFQVRVCEGEEDEGEEEEGEGKKGGRLKSLRLEGE